MYTEYFGIDESPFSISPDPRYLYMSKRHQEALAHLLYGVSGGGGFVLLSGEVGTGKTTICRCLMEQLPDTVDLALILNPRLNELDLLASICDELGVSYPQGTQSLKLLGDVLNRHLLDSHARGRRSVLIIDEAQNLTPAVLEQVRLLTNLETVKTKLLQIILIGQPELNELLARRELRQLAQRITARSHLDPLNAAETKIYIHHRLAVGGMETKTFDSGAVAEVFKRTHGVPRLINSLCDRCLLGAYTRNRRTVDRKMVKIAAIEVFGSAKTSDWVSKILLPVTTAAAAAAITAWFVISDPMKLHLLPGTDTTGPVAEAIVAPAPEETSVTPTKEPAMEPVNETKPAVKDEVTPMAWAQSKASAPPQQDAGAPPDLSPSPDKITGDTEFSGAIDTGKTEPETKNADTDTPPAKSEKMASADQVETVNPKTTEPTEDSGQLTEDSGQLTEDTGQPTEDSGQPTEDTGKQTAKADETDEDTITAVPDLLSTPDITTTSGGDDIFNDPSITGNLETALITVFRQWNHSYLNLSGFAPCTRARTAGLQCLQGHGSWRSLYLLNRPALITLTNKKGKRIHAAVTKFTGDMVTLDLGVRTLTTKSETLNDQWSGDFLILWKPPSVYRRDLSKGMRGDDVAWVYNKIAETIGEPAASKKIVLFDEKLKTWIKTFQESQSLLKDGIVGVRTLIGINTISKTIETPYLWTPEK